MTREQVLDAMKAMPQEERLELAMAVWDVVEAEFPLSDQQKAELDRRIAADNADPTPPEPWSELRPKLLGGEF